MNFLPFILIFLTTLSFYCEMILSNGKSALNRLQLFEKQNFLDHCVEQETTRTAFIYFSGKIKSPKKSIYENYRENSDHYERSKCNLYYCLNSHEGIVFLKQILLMNYRSIISNESILSELVDELKNKFEEIKKTKDSFSLATLFPKSPHLEEIYKNLLVGAYGTEKLEKLFFIDKNAQHKPLCFRYAKTPLFMAALGPELSRSYLSFEEDTYKNSKKKVTKHRFIEFLKSEGAEEELCETIMKIFSFKEPQKKVIHCTKSDPYLQLESSKITAF